MNLFEILEDILLEQNDQNLETNDTTLTYISNYKSQYYLSLKEKWKKDEPGLSEQVMDYVIEIFNRKKNDIIPYREDYTQNGVLFQNLPNQPAIEVLKQLFPDFPVDNIQKLRDLYTYTWEQIFFVTERLINDDLVTDTNQILNNKEKTIQTEIEFWKNYPTKIIDDGNVIVIKINSINDTIKLGTLQHLLVEKYTPIENNDNNHWCITKPANTFYNYYRFESSIKRYFYFVLLPNRNEDDLCYVCVIQPTNIENYILTKRNNKLGDEVYFKSWENLVSYIPEISPYNEYFKFYQRTVQEKKDLELSFIDFENNNSPNYFTKLPYSVQNRYINSGNNINYLEPYKILTKDQLSQYVRGTTINNFTNRFLSKNQNNPFEILLFLKNQRKGIYNELDKYLKGRLLINGVKVIYSRLSLNGFERSYYDTKNKNISLIYNRNKNIAGLYDFKNEEFVVDPIYTELTRFNVHRKIFNQSKNAHVIKVFIVIKYVKSDNVKLNFDENSENINPDSFIVVYNTDKTKKPTYEQKYESQIITDQNVINKLIDEIERLKNNR